MSSTFSTIIKLCSQGKTECKLEKRGCLCGECPIQGEYGLTEFYYCAEGAAHK